MPARLRLRRTCRRHQGFTLVEIAIALVIVLTLMTMGLGALTAFLSSSAAADTRTKQDRIKLALTAYLGLHKRLPCPDVPSPGVEVVGEEDPTSATTCSNTFGVVPFKTLSLSINTVSDGWGNLMSYGVYSDGSTTCPGTGKNWIATGCFGAGKTGGFTIMDGTTTLESQAVAVIVSHGPNGFGAWGRLGTQNVDPPGTRCDEAHNSLSGGSCTLTPNQFYRGGTENNDDVLAYLNANDLIDPLARQGDILSASAQVNEDLNLLYTRVLPLYPTACSSVASSTLDAIAAPVRDPWGNTYSITETLAGSTGLTIAICTSTAAPTSSVISPARCKDITYGTLLSLIGGPCP